MTMRVLIIDDHPMTCAGLKSLLQGYYPQAHIDTRHALIESDVHELAWDYIFLDMHLPGQPFPDLLSALATRLHTVILISAYPEPTAVELARQRGVLGLLPKNIEIEHIIDGFQRIQRGEAIFLDSQGLALLERAQKPRLTKRQGDILGSLLGGLSNKQIARKHDISEYTVKEHVTAILAAYGVSKRLELLLQYRPPVT